MWIYVDPHSTGGDQVAYIRVQKLKRDENGVIIGGSAAIMETQYNKDAAGHSTHTKRETLGRIVDLAEDRKSGIFLSPTRGLVAYDLNSDEFQTIDANDPRVARLPFVPRGRRHAVFGDAYLLLQLMERSGFLAVLKQVFSQTADYERLLLHVVHSFLQDGGSKKCGTFLEQSVLSFILPDIAPSTLRSDYRYFALMGQDETRNAFFRAFVNWMRSKDPAFGRGCYVDSTPLPNDIRNNPYNHLRCQGSQGCSEQTRLALVLDEGTGLPIWYSVIPGNLMDMNTLSTITEDVRATLGIDTVSYVLDAGYVSKGIISHFGEHQDKTLIARMPHRKGYPYMELYRKVQALMYRAKYDCLRKGRVYFGRRYPIELFGQQLRAYVMIDRERALREYEQYRVEHESEFESHTPGQKLWDSVRFGFFILLSNIEAEPQDILTQYLDRVLIEEVFRDTKSFEHLMPLSKWTAASVKGKLLSDMIDTILRCLLLKEIPKYRGSLMDLFYEAASVDCFMENDKQLGINIPSKQARAAFKLFRLRVPARLDLSAWKSTLLAP